jgi:hypothetical protein
MKPAINKAISAAVVTLLRPLVRLLLRNGVPYGAFADLAKRVYVDVATGEFDLPGRKQSKSRVSILTGLSRKEVLRVMRLPAPDDDGAAERYNRAARVIAGWVRDRRFADAKGNPAALLLEGTGPTFSELVKSYSGDTPARAVLDELLRVEAVVRGGDGTLRLLERSYVPRTGEIEKFGILGVDVADLVSTIDRNIRNPRDAVFQRKVCYDNLPVEALPVLKALVNKRGQGLLEHLDRWMSARDRDVNPSSGGTGRKRAGVGIYYFEDDPDGGESR